MTTEHVTILRTSALSARSATTDDVLAALDSFLDGDETDEAA
jgi:hypothetical protein